ncbi:MAG: hypothetical protein K0S38_890 [Candidatus Paceibacter sp.]|jgi:hypothetical protein|nr:hypothetical protein [Candidatus Paceibacter sp.]
MANIEFEDNAVPSTIIQRNQISKVSGMVRLIQKLFGVSESGAHRIMLGISIIFFCLTFVIIYIFFIKPNQVEPTPNIVPAVGEPLS